MDDYDGITLLIPPLLGKYTPVPRTADKQGRKKNKTYIIGSFPML
jgi:hypothetical protein